MPIFYYDRTIPFADSDAAGIVHFSRIACYAEEAEHAFLIQAGYPIKVNSAHAYHWPRVNYQANYLRPLFPFQTIKLQLTSSKIGRSSITWKWSIHDEKTQELHCHGEMKTVCCMVQGGQMKPVPLPEELRRKLLKA
ncbi:acyl-CoA thioesterase [Kiritimatiellota bacterium B12222]|nr:acyl-CoA thioesterase [Kiritimatiellota bacterium B12222]